MAADSPRIRDLARQLQLLRAERKTLEQLNNLLDQLITPFQNEQFEETLIAVDALLRHFQLHGSPKDVASYQVTRALCLEMLGRYEEAEAAHKHVLIYYEEFGPPDVLALRRMSYATCLTSLRRHDEAQALRELALSQSGSPNVPADPRETSAFPSWDNEGAPETLAFYDDSLTHYRLHGSPGDLALCQSGRSILLRKFRRYEEALAANEEVLAYYKHHGAPDVYAFWLAWRASCLARYGQLVEALLTYDEAFAVEDRSVTLLQDPTNRIYAREASNANYRHATLLALQKEQPDRAWGYVQLAKSRTLGDLLGARAEETALDRQGLLLAQQRDAGLVNEETFTAAITRIGYKRATQRQSRLGRDARVPMALADVVETLRPGEVFLDAFTTDNDGSLRLFLLRHGEAAITWTGPVVGEVLTPLVDRWGEARQQWIEADQAQAHNQNLELLASTDPSTKSRLGWLLILGDHKAAMAGATTIEQHVLAELGELVLAPMLEQLDESVTTLIVSPDGLLHRLPLGAMTVPGVDGKSQPLIDRLDLQLVPTATSLAILRGEHGPRVTWPAALLAAAPFATDDPGTGSRSTAPVEPAAHPPFSPRNVVRGDYDLGDLPHSGPEIADVATLLENAGGTKTVIPTPEATRARLKDGLLGAHILHLATHGGALAPDESVMDYRIFLADRTEMRVREFYEGGLSLKDVFLVTLSVCSLGEVVLQGAEASGFVQAFLQAGAGVVLAPLWAVDDHATMLLMVRFYEELTGDARPTVATAWRRACHWLRTQTPYNQPVYWAGFLPSGDASLRLTATT
jgi:CHAT domain-containing protein